MAQVKAKTTQNGAGKKPKPQSSAPSTGTSTPVTTVASTTIEPATYHGKPDKALYDTEQDKIKGEIDALQKKLTAVKDKIGFSNKNGPAQERRSVILEELKGIRNEQGNVKQNRTKIFEDLKALNDEVAKKTKELNASKGKLPFKTLAEADAAIKQLESKVESGSMKVADEKRALADINQYKRTKRMLETFSGSQSEIDATRAKADELRKQLDDPESKAMSERYDKLQAELDEIKKETDEAHSARGKLLDERTALQAQLDDLYNQKRDSAARYREANDKYWAKVNEERARRAERIRSQRMEEEARKKREIVERIREEAEAPAFQSEIEDCQTLIDYFSGKTNAPKLSTDEKKALEGVPELDIRKVEAGPSEGMIVRKKKGEDDSDAFFVGGGGKKKGKKHHGGAAKAEGGVANGADPSAAVHVPMGTLTALLQLSIPPPAAQSDLSRVVEDLKTKKAWFEANQARVTAENKAKAEKDIEKLGAKIEKLEAHTHHDATPPNGDGEKSAEPAPSSAVDGVEKSDTAVEDQAEVVAETETVAVEEQS